MVVRRYASQLDAVVGDQNLTTGILSLLIDFSGHQPTLLLLEREEKAIGCPQKSTFK
jgi:hypothetical protein